MSLPTVAGTREELRKAVGEASVVLVPTMGALHDGHASLMRLARERAGAEGVVVVSIFVNPTQFGPGEDYDRYPRTFDADLEVCSAAGVDVVFAPEVDEVYPPGGGAVTVQPGPLGEVLEGASRPGHFAGVLTVVAKLFNLVEPEVAIFGEKDYQQLALIRRMAADLCFDVDVVGAPTVRDSDGLALSSRNRYLSDAERTAALTLSQALQAAVAAAGAGAHAARAAALAVLAGEPAVDLDYLVLTTPDLVELDDDAAPGPARVLVAARVGATRLIDNLPLRIGEG